MTIAQIVSIVAGAVLIVGGFVFVFARKSISALAIRKDADPYKKPFMMSPTAMLVGGIVCILAGVAWLLAGFWPNA